MSATLDVFGIKKVYRDCAGGPGWDSLHWALGGPRTIQSGDKDPFDPWKCSENRGNVTWSIDGDGNLNFNGTKSGTTEPRLHLNNPCQFFFRNVECTFYMKRITDNDTNWGGANIGVRSGPNGHSLSNEYCDAHTYYQRLRHDGNSDAEKELKHPDSSVKASAPIWGGNRFPKNKWIGFKSVTRNAGNGVKLQLFIDETEGKDGGTWTMLHNIGDTNKWAPPQTNPSCGYPADYVPLLGGGVIVLRNTGVTECLYKWMSVREIISSMIPGSWQPPPGLTECKEITEDDPDTVLEGERCTCDYIEPTEPITCINCDEGQCSVRTNDTTSLFPSSWLQWLHLL